MLNHMCNFDISLFTVLASSFRSFPEQNKLHCIDLQYAVYICSVYTAYIHILFYWFLDGIKGRQKLFVICPSPAF